MSESVQAAARPVTPATRGRIVVLGFAFWYPLAGVTYQFLHYLLGLRKLGYDVYYVESARNYVYDPDTNDRSPDTDRNVARIAPILEHHGFSDRWSFHVSYDDVDRSYGIPPHEVRRILSEADAVLNVTGWHVLDEDHMRVPVRAYVESDPFSLQVDVANGSEDAIDALASHTHLFSFGENIGSADCLVPTVGRVWEPTRQPVAMELWAHQFTPSDSYTTITTWQNSNKHREYLGEPYYWTKNREFEKFIDLPARHNVRFEMATHIDTSTHARLQALGWNPTDSLDISTDMDRYREYIQRSRAEFTVARDQYVRPRTGWFSDRSATYLAAGRPVITQDSAFDKVLPVGRGLFSFSSMDEILAAIDAIESDYDLHSRAALQIAHEYFTAEKVVGSILSRCGL